MRGLRVLISGLLLASVAQPASAQSNSTGLAGLLLRFFSPENPVLLAPNLANPVQSHDAHFRSQANAQATLRQLNAGIAAQLATFPIGSSSGGFTYTFDETLGVYNRTTQSFGPIFAERPLTLGKNKFALAVNYQHASWDRFEGRDLSGGDLPLYLTHEDTNRDGGSLNLFFEGDIIKADLAIDLKTDTTVLLATYGVSGKLDVGVAVPFLSIDMDANVTTTIDPIATVTTPAIVHQFDQNGTQSHVYPESGHASGIGDMLLRTKWNFYRGASASAALGGDLRLPTGDEADLLGSGATQFKLWGVIGGRVLDWIAWANCVQSCDSVCTSSSAGSIRRGDCWLAGVYSNWAPLSGCRSITLPTDGSDLYDCDEKLSQMLPAIALVAIGLQMLVASSVTGTRSSVDR